MSLFSLETNHLFLLTDGPMFIFFLSSRLIVQQSLETIEQGSGRFKHDVTIYGQLSRSKHRVNQTNEKKQTNKREKDKEKEKKRERKKKKSFDKRVKILRALFVHREK